MSKVLLLFLLLLLEQISFSCERMQKICVKEFWCKKEEKKFETLLSLSLANSLVVGMVKFNIISDLFFLDSFFLGVWYSSICSLRNGLM